MMKNIKRVTAIICSLVIVMLQMTALAEDTPDGTPEKPFLISNAEEFLNIKNNLTASYRLTENIDFSDTAYQVIGDINSGSFQGTLDGNGHTVKNVTINSSGNKYVGLFGCLEGSVTNLNIENISICDTATRYIGGIAGYVSDSGSITYCNALSGSIRGEYSVIDLNLGGIAGYSVGEINYCKNYMEVLSDGSYNYYNRYKYVGGIVGCGNADNCENNGKIWAYGGSPYAGGISGYGNVSGSKNYGDINGRGYTVGVGGIVGYGGNATDCVNSGVINSTGLSYERSIFAGGIMGYSRSYSLVNNCINSGTVNSTAITNSSDGNSYAGGIIGYGFIRPSVNECINNGNVRSTGGDDAYAGGIAGYNSDTVKCINNGTISGGYAGGIAGGLNGNYSSVSKCVNYGIVSGRYACGIACMSSCYDCLNMGTVFADSYAYGVGNTTYNCSNQGIFDGPSNKVYNIGSDVKNLYSKKPEVQIKTGNRYTIDLELYKYDRELTWESSDGSVATVDENGTVTAVGEGVAIVTAKTVLGISAPTVVTVTGYENAEVKTISKTSASLLYGETLQLSVTTEPVGQESAVTWASNNTTVATVSSTGLVTAKKAGTAAISATINNGKTLYCIVKVTSSSAYVEVESVSIPENDIMLAADDMVMLNAAVIPSNATEKKLVYTSDNESVATVNENGLVTAHSAGTALITATGVNGKSDSCYILVTDADSTSISLSDARGNAGGEAEVKASIVKNPGISAYKLTLKYNASLFTPKEVVLNKKFGGSLTSNAEDANGELNVVWYSNSDNNTNGELFTAVFTVNENAQNGTKGDVSLSYKAGDICNTQGRSFGAYLNPCKITVSEPIPGDVYEDDSVSVYDLTLLSRYVTGLERFSARQIYTADVNNDGEVDIKDVVRLAQYMAGKQGVSLMSLFNTEDSAEINIKTAAKDENGDIYIPVDMKANIAGFKFNVEYDSNSLEILDIVPNTEILAENFQTNLGQENNNGLIITWYDTDNAVIGGTAFVIKARSKDGKPAKISIAEKENNMCDDNERNVIGSYKAGYALQNEMMLDFDDEGVYAYTTAEHIGEKVILWFADYSSDNRLNSCSSNEFLFTEEKTILPEFVPTVNASYVKIMLWDNMNSMMPACDSVKKVIE